MSIAENVAKIKAQMREAAIAAGRDPKDILLCAATKMNDAENVRQAIAAGVDCCGENRVQELTQKLSQNAYEGAPVHFIGHLQTNKVKQVVGKVSLIHSVDSLRLLEAIHKEAAKQGICQDILLEINIGNEDSKSGFHKEELPAIFEKIGASVDWNPQTSTVTATKGDVSVSLTVNSTEATKNGEKVELDVPAKIVDGRTLVPVRFISDCFNVDVVWDEVMKKVILTSK